MRKVFLDELPKNKYGNKQRIDWENSIGYKVKFIYDDIEGEVEIIDYIKENQHPSIYIYYNNKSHRIYTDNFLKCALGELLNMINRNFKYKIGENFTNNFSQIQIIEQIRMPQGKYTQKGYKYKCLKCGNED